MIHGTASASVKKNNRGRKRRGEMPEFDAGYADLVREICKRMGEVGFSQQGYRIATGGKRISKQDLYYLREGSPMMSLRRLVSFAYDLGIAVHIVPIASEEIPEPWRLEMAKDAA